jgi:dynamin 1-like protein
MIYQYISKPNAIILAVTAANQDLSTSDALKLAREVDPDGSRTIGVLTKLDLMDKGTDASGILLGRHLPMANGWIGIVNRSQQDINQKKSIQDALSAESDYFAHHPNYRNLTDRTGTGVLGERCSKLLTDHIKKTLPKLRSQISEMIKRRRAELEAYGEPIVLDNAAAKGWQMLQILNNFSQDFRSAIEGSNTADFDTKELNGGARIRYIFSESFAKSLNDLKSTSGLSTSDIRTAIRNAAGPKPALFVPEKAFEQLVKRQIELLRDPALLCVDQVHAELLRIVASLDAKDLSRFPKLRERIVDVATSVLKRSLKETTKMIDTLIKLELSWINTSHPDFTAVNILMQQQPPPSQDRQDDSRAAQSQQNTRNNEESGGGIFAALFGGGGKKPEPAPAPTIAAPPKPAGSRWNEPPPTIRIDDTQITEREKQQVNLIKGVLDSYFNIVKKSLQDYVVKAVMLSLVNYIKENLQRELVAALYKEDLYSDLLFESEDISVKRRVARDELEALQKVRIDI